MLNFMQMIKEKKLCKQDVFHSKKKRKELSLDKLLRRIDKGFQKGINPFSDPDKYLYK